MSAVLVCATIQLMGFFGRKRQPGITEYELTKQKLHSRLSSVFGYRTTGKRKMAALDAALAMAMDPDRNTPSTQQVIQEDEFNAIIANLEEGGLITSEEAKKLRAIAAEDLRD